MQHLGHRKHVSGNGEDESINLFAVVGALIIMPGKKAILVLLNLVMSAQNKCLRSTQGSSEQVRVVTGGGSFSNANHLWTLSEDQHDGKKAWDIVYEYRLKGLVRDLKGTDKRLLLRAKGTGAWLIVCSTIVSGTVLSATEFRDFLCDRYSASPVNLQIHCDGCGTAFGVTHELICSIGGLVITCHNEICDKLLYLLRRTFTSASIHTKSLIHQSRTRSKIEICQGSDKHKDTHGGVMI